MPPRNIKQGDGETSSELLRHRLWTLNTFNDWAPISYIAFFFPQTRWTKRLLSLLNNFNLRQGMWMKLKYTAEPQISLYLTTITQFPAWPEACLMHCLCLLCIFHQTAPSSCCFRCLSLFLGPRLFCKSSLVSHGLRDWIPSSLWGASRPDEQ